jgi:UPF0716 family protein affecting phage T7 exclusion
MVEPMALFASHIGSATAILLLLGTAASGMGLLGIHTRRLLKELFK